MPLSGMLMESSPVDYFSFANILKRKRSLVALLLLSYRCIVTINVLWLFLMVPWVGMQCMIVVFPGHTHLLFEWLIETFGSVVCCFVGNLINSALNGASL